MDIKEIVRDNVVRFERYRQGYAYYSVEVPPQGARYVFPVPLDDVGDATLGAVEKAIVFLRYIRRALDDGTFVQAA